MNRGFYEDHRGWKKGKRVYTDEEEIRIATIKKAMIKRGDYFLGSPYVQMNYAFQHPKDRLPSEWFVEDVVRRRNLQTREPKKRTRGMDIVKRLLFPIKSIIGLGKIQQSADFIGKKFILGSNEPISFFATGYYQSLKLYQMWRIQAETVECATACLKQFWVSHPIPHVFRIDNAMTWRGAGQLVAHLGRFLKFLLNLNIIPLFSSPYESFTNPHIEGGNSVFAQKLWTQHTFTNGSEIDRECDRFNSESQRFYEWKFKEQLSKKGLRYVKLNQELATESLRSTRGKKITFIRRVQRWAEEHHTCGIVLLNRFIPLPESYNNQYVFTVINLETATLHVYSEHDGISTEILHQPFPYTF